MNTILVMTERVSALIDGELDPGEFEAVVVRLCGDPDLLREWHELHRAGDALRSHEVAACDAQGFCARVSAALASEPTVLAPRAEGASRVRRYWVPGLAVAASMAAVGFVAVPLLRAPESVPVARSIQPVLEASAIDVASQKALPTIANARELSPSFNPYLAAHHELIGNSVVPRAVYLRSSDER
ncbi:MAG: sigma-E factor negative regulatory protein [Burkholderiaceae bacterium]